MIYAWVVPYAQNTVAAAQNTNSSLEFLVSLDLVLGCADWSHPTYLRRH